MDSETVVQMRLMNDMDNENENGEWKMISGADLPKTRATW